MEHANMENTGCYHGGMVAFEGPADIVSTQLRLLPPSSQVLILPDLEHYMKKGDEEKFTARSYIKDVHEAAQARHEVALQFLGDSNRGNKRLVFLNGGTAGAVSQCISAISHRQTSGDSLHAEMVLREVLREGVQGLDREGADCNEFAVPGPESVCTRDACTWEDEEIEEDPITKAMKAADALYKETESLEPIECYIRTRPRSLSYPMPGWMDSVGQSSPFFVFGSPPNEEAQAEPRVENEAHFEDGDNSPRCCTLRASTQCSEMTIPMAYRPSSSMERSCITRSIASISHTRNQSSTSNTLLSPPMSPSEVEFGEARIVQMQASKKAAQPLRRTRSLDDMELHRTRMRRQVISSPPPLVPEVTSSPATLDIKSPCRHLSIMEDPFSNNNLIRLPRAKFVRANTTTIRKSPTFAKPPYSMASNSCADQDTNSEPGHINKDDHNEIVRDPVLPFHEDLVIQFMGEISNPILDSVIGSLQIGLYPVSTLPHDCDGTAETASCPSTPRTADLFDVDDFNGGLSPVAEVPSIDEAVDYDAKSTGGFSRASNFRFHSPCPSLPPEVQPPTPIHTPPILGTDADSKRSKFQVVSTIDRVNAIAIQNNLRSILDAQFPPEQDRRYRVSRFSLLPQMDKIWRPIFWNTGSKGRIPSERTADLILAIGAQNSVKTEFVCALTGQIEKLGSKSTGMTRSGRLDLRFLVANAMQSFTTQSLATQLQGNPFDSPHLLACLIVPHLATYLSVNASTRFLILEYPAEHLATVVALQNLIGVDILKIAGIIDSEAASAYNTEPSSPISSFQSSRWSDDSMTNNSAAQLAKSLDAISLPGSPFPHPFPLQSPFGSGPTLAQRRRLSFSKANYVLTNTATEAEISSFISIIWRILIQADAFYTPEHGAFMAARATVRYPTTKTSNCSLVSSKFAPASTAPSTPAPTTPGALSTSLNHPCYPHWGLSGSLLSPPSSRGSGADTDIPSSFSRLTVQRSVDYEYPHYAPPLLPVPPPPSSTWSRDASPSGVSLRSVQSRGRLGTSTSGLSATHTSIHARKASVSPSPVADADATGLAASVTSPVVGDGAGAGAIASGGFLRSKSLNRILASRRGRKASGGAPMSLHDPTSVPASPGVGGIETTPPVPAIPTSKKTSAVGGGGGNRDSTTGRPPLHLEVHIHGRDSLLVSGHHSNKLGADMMHNNADATSAYAMSIVDEGEFYDDEERRLMPMYMRQSEIRKGNSRKALKWLGLA